MGHTAQSNTNGPHAQYWRAPGSDSGCTTWLHLWELSRWAALVDEEDGWGRSHLCREGPGERHFFYVS